MTDALAKFHQKYISYIFIILLGFLAFIVYSDYLLLNKLFLFKDIGSDTLNTFYPQFVHIADYLRSDGMPLWSFNRGMGQSILATSLGNPFKWPLFALGSDQLAYGIAYMEVVKVVLGGTIFFLYLRQMSLSIQVCAVGGMLYAFSGFMIVGSAWYIFSTTAVYFALLLYAFERYLQHGVVWIFPLVISLISAEQVFDLYTHALFLIIYGVFRYYDSYGWHPQAMARFFLKLIGLGTIGMGMAAIFLFANVHEITQSHRIGNEVSSKISVLQNKPILAFPEEGDNVVSLLRSFSSNMTGVGSNYHGSINFLEDPLFYCGLITLLLAPQIFAFLGRRQLILYSTLALISLIPVLFPYFRYAFWLFAGNYYRVLSLFIIMIALLFALKALENIMVTGRLNVRLLVVTLLVLLSCLYYPYELSGKYGEMIIDSSLRNVTAALLCLYTFLIVGLSQKKYRVPATILLFIVLASELGMTATKSVNERPAVTSKEYQERVGYNDYSVDMIERIKKHDKAFYRIEKTYSSTPASHHSFNDSMVQDYWGTSSYHSWNQSSYLDFMNTVGLISKLSTLNGQKWVRGVSERPILLMLVSAKYILVKEQEKLKKYTDMGFRVIDQTNDVIALQNLLSLPFGFTYDTYMSRNEFIQLEDWQKDIALIRAAIIDQPTDEAISQNRYRRLSADNIGDFVEGKQLTSDIKAKQSQALHIDSFSQNRISGRISLIQDRILCFTIPFDSGWKARVDGKPIKLHKINIGFTGLMIGPGTHTVELEYQPNFWIAGWIISLASILVYLFLIWKTKKFKAEPYTSYNHFQI